ncbi:MAG: phenylalanine--tRNA ligase subunit beta [Phycisphaerales bacterium]
MKVTFNWINEYLDPPASTVDELVAGLERAGFPCEERESIGDGDTALDFEITSNRGDCASVVGLAREFAAATDRSMQWPDCAAPAGDARSSDAATVENKALDRCPFYSARIIEGVKVGPSPDWLVKRLEGVGLRPVNNVVDITNYVLYELGQPLHAFDLDKLTEQTIIVRCGEKGETIVAIDGSKHEVDERMLIIADARRPVAIAGVMGGLDSEVGERTSRLLLEAAVFDPASVRATSRRLRLMSDSSYRFERGIHPATVDDAADRAARLITEVAGGSYRSEPLIEAAPMPERRTISLRLDRLRALAGVDIPADTAIQILSTLGLEPRLDRDGAKLVCVAPPYRLDLTREIDLVEEVVRLYGFHRIEPRERLEFEVIGLDALVENRRQVDETLAACGFHEAVTVSFCSINDANAFLPEGFDLLLVQDDRRKAEPVLQPSVLPGLLRCRKRNQDAGRDRVRLFERAACFCMKGSDKLEQRNLGLVLDAVDEQEGLRVVRAALEQVVRIVAGGDARFTLRPMAIRWYAPDSAAAVLVNDQVVGTMGIVSPSIRDVFDLQTPVAAAEVNLAEFESETRRIPQVANLATQPAISRDLSIVVEEPIAWSKIEDVIAEVDPADLESVEFVGVYRGKQVGAGKKSVTLRLTFRHAERTLRHEEVDPVIDSIVKRFGVELDATLRE